MSAAQTAATHEGLKRLIQRLPLTHTHTKAATLTHRERQPHTYTETPTHRQAATQLETTHGQLI